MVNHHRTMRAFLADWVYFLLYSVLPWKAPSGRLMLSAAAVYLQPCVLLAQKK